MKLQDKTVAFLGDSITAGVGTSNNGARFSELLKNNAKLKDIKNYGISATRIARQQKITDEFIDTRSFCERVDEIESCDIIVVFGGTNDYGHGDAKFGKFDDRTPDTYCGAVHYLMAKLIENHPTSEIVFITPLHRENENNLNASNNLPLKAYVDIIKKTAEFYGLPVLDLYSTSGICPDIEISKKTYCPDGLHPNDLGNMRIAQRLEAFLHTL